MRKLGRSSSFDFDRNCYGSKGAGVQASNESVPVCRIGVRAVQWGRRSASESSFRTWQLRGPCSACKAGDRSDVHPSDHQVHDEPQIQFRAHQLLAGFAAIPTSLKAAGISTTHRTLPCSTDAFRYFRALPPTGPRVKAFSIGKARPRGAMTAVAVPTRNC